MKGKSMTIKEMYKITSPLNYQPIKEIPHGEHRFFSIIPEWAKNNPFVVVEKEIIHVSSATKKRTEELQQKAKQTGKRIRVCRECGYQTTSFKRMRLHKRRRHSIITDKTLKIEEDKQP